MPAVQQNEEDSILAPLPLFFILLFMVRAYYGTILPYGEFVVHPDKAIFAGSSSSSSSSSKNFVSSGPTYAAKRRGCRTNYAVSTPSRANADRCEGKGWRKYINKYTTCPFDLMRHYMARKDCKPNACKFLITHPECRYLLLIVEEE